MSHSFVPVSRLWMPDDKTTSNSSGISSRRTSKTSKRAGILRPRFLHKEFGEVVPYVGQVLESGREENP